MNQVSFPSSDGLLLSGVWHISEKTSAKAIILAHGITADRDEDGIFIDLAQVLADTGYAVLRFDFRGHGASEGDPVNMTIAGELADLEAALGEVIDRGYKQIGLVGASFGGGVSTLFTANQQDWIRCLCLWNPCLNYDHTFLNPILPWIRDRKNHMKKDMEEKGWTTLGSRKFKVGKPLWDEMAKTFPYEAMKAITIPTVIIHGDQDTYVPYEDSVVYLSNLQSERELITIPGGEHGFQDIPGQDKQAIEKTLQFFKKYL